MFDSVLVGVLNFYRTSGSRQCGLGNLFPRGVPLITRTDPSRATPFLGLTIVFIPNIIHYILDGRRGLLGSVGLIP